MEEGTRSIEVAHKIMSDVVAKKKQSRLTHQEFSMYEESDWQLWEEDQLGNLMTAEVSGVDSTL